MTRREHRGLGPRGQAQVPGFKRPRYCAEEEVAVSRGPGWAEDGTLVARKGSAQLDLRAHVLPVPGADSPGCGAELGDWGGPCSPGLP